MRRVIACVAVAAGLAAAAPVAAAQPPRRYEPTKASLAKHPLPGWWHDGKFGIFIHWGPYSVPAFAPPDPPSARIGEALGVNANLYAEWYWFWQQFPGLGFYEHHLATYGADKPYDAFIGDWKAERYDPRAWVDLFKRAGARYFVLTTKHHDGVALWPTATSDRDTAAIGPRRDLVGALMRAAEGSGLRKGVYYSIPEWFTPAPKPRDAHVFAGDPAISTLYTLAFNTFPTHDPYLPVVRPRPYTGYRPITDYADGQVRPQIAELVDRYRPDILWCDIGGNEAYFRSNEVIADYYNAAARTNPDGVVVDDRCGDRRTHRDYATSEYAPTTPPPPFEVTRGMGRSFGYNQAERAEHYLTVPELVRTLVTTVAAGGNVLLDIGPRADGTIPEIMASRLEGIGAWLDINGEAIYATRPWNPSEAAGLRFTKGRSGFLYATALEWPGKELAIDAPVPLAPGTRIALLGSDEKSLAHRRDGSKLIVQLPAERAAAATRSEHAYTLRIGARLTARLTARTRRRPASSVAIGGTLVLPDGLLPETGCRGSARVVINRAKRTVATRRARIDANCRYRAHFRVRPRGRLRARVTFAGNPVLRPARTALSVP